MNKKQTQKIMEILAELFVNHPNKEYSYKDIYKYLKSKGIKLTESELYSIILDMQDLKIIENVDYYKLNTQNPAIKYFLKKCIK